jgi:hypothetical protein
MWRAGDVLTLRWLRNDPADLIAPVRMVEHDDRRTILYLAAGTPLKARADRDGVLIGRDRPFLERERQIASLVDTTWTTNHTLMVHEPHRLGSAWLFWNESDWSFQGYYVNLQAPLEASSVGYDTADFLLDIVVDPDLSWSWKDEEEFDEALEHEIIAPVLLHAVKADGRRFVREIEARQWPFDGSLESWRPDSGWHIPELPDGWETGLQFPG